MDSSTNSGLLESVIFIIQDKLNLSGVCQDLVSTWLELWDEEEINSRKEILAEECGKELKEFLQEVLLKERKTRNEYIDRVEKLLDEIRDLQNNLEVVIPYEDVESLPLHNMAVRLNKKAEKYRLIKDERVNKFNELSNKEAVLCEILGMVPNKINQNRIPSTDEIKQLENQLAAMEQEKTDRTFTFLEKRQAICNLYRELGIRPSLRFEKEIVSDDVVKNFKVTNENMNRLDELQKKLEEQLEEAKQTVEEVCEKLKILWNYLDEPEEHQEHFMNGHQGHSAPVVNALKEELKRCEKRKKENISKIVGRIRGVLIKEWDKCMISQEERNKFRPLHIDCFTEDLCDLHEFEIERLKNFYRENEQIFTLIAKQENLFNRLLNLENGVKGANRYYNRGGQLLQEERERRTVFKELPVVEEELKSLLKQFEEKNGKPFTSFGVPVVKNLEEKWNAHFDQKTIEKIKKGMEKTGKTPLGKRICTTPAPSSATKVSRLNNEKVVSSNTKLVTPRMPRKPFTIKKKIKTEENSEVQTTFCLDPTYEDFQRTLQAKVQNAEKEKQGGIRSTAVMDNFTPITNVLREHNTPTPFLRSATTPIKSTRFASASPMWSPCGMKTPKTLPRTTRRQGVLPHRTPSGSRVPIITSEKVSKNIRLNM